MTTKKETRLVKGFSVVELRGIGELFIHQNTEPDGEEHLEIEADETLLPRLKNQVDGDRLILGLESPGWDLLGWIDWLTLPKEAKFYVSMNQVREISVSGSSTVHASPLSSELLHLVISGSGKMMIDEVECKSLSSMISGSGNIKIEKIDCGEINMVISGAGEYQLAGKSDKQSIRVSGSGKLLAGELDSEETSIKISGSGFAVVSVNQALDVSISGSGEVQYRGNPKITQHISGSGKIVGIS
jgi:hypothetical protein